MLSYCEKPYEGELLYGFALRMYRYNEEPESFRRFAFPQLWHRYTYIYWKGHQNPIRLCHGRGTGSGRKHKAPFLPGYTASGV